MTLGDKELEDIHNEQSNEPDQDPPPVRNKHHFESFKYLHSLLLSNLSN